MRSISFIFSLLFLGVLPLSIHALAYPECPLIGITQITSHASLDKVRAGAIDALSSAGYTDGKTAHILFENAQGNIAVASQIGQKFAAKAPDVVIAIATPSAQAVIKATSKQKTPVVFASVTDPVDAQLVESLASPAWRATGTRNASDFAKQLDLITSVLPHAKKIGVVVNFAEQNSQDLLKDLSYEASLQDIEVFVTAVSNSSEVSGATRQIVSEVDLILLLQDNTVASALPALLKVCSKEALPVFSTYVEAVEKGASIGYAADEYAIGQQTGAIAARILKGEDPALIAVEDPDKYILMASKKRVQSLQLSLSDDLLKRVTWVE